MRQSKRFSKSCDAKIVFNLSVKLLTGWSHLQTIEIIVVDAVGNNVEIFWIVLRMNCRGGSNRKEREKERECE